MKLLKSPYRDAKHLLQLIKDKDYLAFEHLYDQYASALYGLILQKISDPTDSALILEKVFMRIWQMAYEYCSENQSVFSWMHLKMLQELSNASSVSLVELPSLSAVS